ncbi:hypothetical protein [Candidatus Mycoplasma mahonii]|uniref:hypothetical protein n=1 Tax=Candidatus Mycoplasma mahonii TaxID=3004105 RepID=UPI0026F094BE|nr:hypothetical protein [Candidatus Mycoplasma mahonii]WKX02540.1 hypothetical protein O3I44_00460 [Candidatus Mycoplasma mahonii]
MKLKETGVNALFLKIFDASSNIIVGLASGQYADFEVDGILWYLPLIIIIGSIPGSLCGSLLSKKMNEKHITILFHVVMAITLTWEIIFTILISQGIM